MRPRMDFLDPQQLDCWPNGCCVPFLYSEVFLFCILRHSLSASALCYVIWTMKPPRAWEEASRHSFLVSLILLYIFQATPMCHIGVA